MADGIGPGGQALDPLMPRYALTTREVEALAAYLGSPAPHRRRALRATPSTWPPWWPPMQAGGARPCSMLHCAAEHGPRPEKRCRSCGCLL